MSKESKHDWEAESDARTMAESDVIRSDTERFGKARKAAEDMAQAKQIEATAMTRIAAGKKGIRKHGGEVDIGF